MTAKKQAIYWYCFDNSPRFDKILSTLEKPYQTGLNSKESRQIYAYLHAIQVWGGWEAIEAEIQRD